MRLQQTTNCFGYFRMEMSSTASGDPDFTVNWQSGSIMQQYMYLSVIVYSHTWVVKFPTEYELLLL